jgi:hypothetical protein
MTNRNEHRDGPPSAGDLWARAAQSPQGHFGVSFGIGPRVIGFVLEELLPEMTDVMRREHGPEAAKLVRAAAETLPMLKESVRQLRTTPNN